MIALPERKNVLTGYILIDRILRFITTLYWITLQIPIHGLKVYPPIILLSFAAAFASAQFAIHRNVFPFPLNWFQAIAFEWVYIGSLAMASTKRGKWFYRVLIAGAGTAVIYITLYAATRYGLSFLIRAALPMNVIPLWSLITTVLLILAHGMPLTLVNVVYGFLIHSHLVEQADKQAELDKRIFCPFNCGYYSTSEPAVRGHRAQCPNKPTKV